MALSLDFLALPLLVAAALVFVSVLAGVVSDVFGVLWDTALQQHVQPESLYMLQQTPRGVQVDRPRESFGKNVDRVLEDLMGLATTRPDAVESSLRDIFLAIDNGGLQEARGKIEGLRKSIGDDPDLVRADVLIRRKEIIGK